MSSATSKSIYGCQRLPPTGCPSTPVPLIHFACRCPLDLEVCFLAPEEQDELLLQPLAAQDSAGVPLPDAATPDSLEEEAPGAPAAEDMSEESF
ncbi:hypothetical protein C0992_012387 [Termitomyces sp. T32_za158]|nr:hypothetical protein C0992_012387 [Termitomyces sp. T32_za158]